MKLSHEINGQGNHRITAKMLDGKVIESDWQWYRGIANLTIKGNTYIACTQYYDGTALKPETIYQISEVKG